MGVNIFSYNGGVTVGLRADAGLIPDADAITGAGPRCGKVNRMANRSAGEESSERGDTRLTALTEELGAQLQRLGAAGPKVTQLLSVIQLERPSGQALARPLGAMVQAREPLPVGRVRRVIEQDLEARLPDVFSAFEEQPFAPLAATATADTTRSREASAR